MNAPERRQTPTERLHELAMSIASRQSAAPESSVDLTRNARGDVQFAVTVRHTDAGEAEREARLIFDRLAAAYPRQENGNGS